MHRIFQRFIDHLSTSGDVDSFTETMAVVATALDLHCFAYLALPRQLGKKPMIMSTYPSNWVAHYVRNHYERLDPVVMQALATPEPFKWGMDIPLRRLSPQQKEFINHASEFGIRLGFTVPIHDGHGPVAALTFAADQKRPRFENCIDTHARVLQLIAMCFHAHVRRKLSQEVPIDGVLLSPRELECLEWASQGKSSWEIGQILGISRNTAASYLDTVKEKLGVRTVVQAAMRLAAAKKSKQN
ncbi:LuxR family transcriptional regulator [Bradyrhizobium mercantei]|uniref:LuxR family transcriptional regulator n=1 Tax=Bradyrhizobium mercantei TaxID=1904807 RepID=UPI000978992A|nr:LuxR family transcriptional regulator [Bradyrhizobium mercantei]